MQFCLLYKIVTVSESRVPNRIEMPGAKDDDRTWWARARVRARVRVRVRMRARVRIRVKARARVGARARARARARLCFIHCCPTT